MDLPPHSPAPPRSASSASFTPRKSDSEERGSNGLKHTTLSSSQTTTPLSSAPQTPTWHTAPRSPSSLRRPSSSASFNTPKSLSRQTSSPKLKSRDSRSSLSGSVDANDTTPKRPTPKRSISNLISGLRDAQATMESIPEPVVLTAPEVAKAHFTQELARLEQNDEAETLVVLHDACYGHRFSRPKTSRSALSMIVERPERLHAGVLGAATAFVRLGGHHQEGAHPPHNTKAVEGPPPFKIRRTRRAMDITSECVTNVHGTAWMGELKGMSQAAGERLSRSEKELARPPSPSGKAKKELHQGDLYLCGESLNAFQGALGGVADAIDAVFSPSTTTKRSFVAVRPPGHHCSADFPSGFCWLNNVHVGLEYAAQTHGLTHAAIVDFDLHHGDGSQAIAWQRNSKNNEKRMNAKPNSKLKLGPDIGYYSLHDINSYPCEMGDDEKVQAASLCVENAHSQSVWNVHLQPWKSEEEFWQLYETRYRVLLHKARIFLQHHTSRIRREGKVQPKAAIFISAGFDASEWEGEGMQRHKVNVPTEFYARFTKDMVKLAQEDGTGCDGRVISVLEGGYSDRALCSGVLSHLSGLSMQSPRPRDTDHPNGQYGLGASMTNSNGAFDLEHRMNGLSLGNGNVADSYDKSWWSRENLTALELKVNPPPPPGPGGKKRIGPQPTYATPTESFAYKVVDPQKFARSISGTFRDVPTGMPVRPPTPPLPDVDWIIATQELSKLLIPQDRQTKSCTPEELAGPKVSKAAAPSTAQREEAEKPRQLRTRAAKPAGPDALEGLRVQSRADRRRTIADLPMSNDGPPPVQQRRSSRRSSMASTLSSEILPQDVDAPPPPAPAVPTVHEGEMKPPPAIATTTNGDMKPPSVPGGPNGIQVKKTRAAPKLKRAPAAASAPVSPAKNASSTSSDAPQGYKAPAMQEQPAIPGAQPSYAQLGVPDVDSLTTGMKKVTLKVGTREDHDRKQKERQDAANKSRALKAAETRRTNAAAKKAAAAAAAARPVTNIVPVAATPQSAMPAPSSETVKAETMQAPAQPAMANTSNDADIIMGERPQPPAPESLQAPEPTAVEPSAPVPPQTATFEDVPLAPTHEPSAVEPMSLPQPSSAAEPSLEAQPPAQLSQQYQQAAMFSSVPAPTAFTPSSSDAIPQAEPPKQLASPATGRPGSAMDRKDLPVFTSTGPIPFAAPPASTAQAPAAPALDTNIPTSSSPDRMSGTETPRKSSYVHHPSTIVTSKVGPRRSTPNLRPETKSDPDSAGAAENKNGQADIWEVPETPAK